MKEEWKDVPGWEGLYKVSNLGRCFSVRKNRIKPSFPNNYGYLRLACYEKDKKQKFFVHRLVAQLFVEGQFEGAVVNHIDGDRKNNVWTNLEWCTVSENEKHAYRSNLKERKKIKRPLMFVPSEGDPSAFIYETITEASRSLGVDEKRIHHLLKTNEGVIPELNGFIFVARLTTSPDECKGVEHK